MVHDRNGATHFHETIGLILFDYDAKKGKSLYNLMLYNVRAEIYPIDEFANSKIGIVDCATKKRRNK